MLKKLKKVWHWMWIYIWHGVSEILFYIGEKTMKGKLSTCMRWFVYSTRTGNKKLKHMIAISNLGA